ncbi:MAG: ABC transporter permease [Rhodospirillales bacterium]|nr:ABC transporter permease [Rhodospirillales bacterium]
MAERRPVAFRGGGFAHVPVRGAALVAFVGLVAFWEFAVARGYVSPIFLPAPSSVLLALGELWNAGTLWRHVSESLVRLAGGWTVGTGCGLAAGFAIGVWSLGRAVGVPFVSALFPIPKISLLPLLILWLGIGEASKIATIALGVFFPTAIATYAAIDAVPRNLIRMAQSFDLPAADVLRKVVLPGALPGILAGFRISTSIALILLVSAEMIGAQYGIGAFILQAGNLMLTDQLLAGVLLISILGLALGTALTRIERRLLRWR